MPWMMTKALPSRRGWEKEPIFGEPTSKRSFDEAERRAEQSTSSSPLTNNKRAGAEHGESSREEEPKSSKRARRGDQDVAGRSRRMFGLLTSTLNKAKADHVKRASGEEGRKRAEVEARLQEKLQRQDESMREASSLTEELRTCGRKMFMLVAELEADDAAIRLRKAQKRRLASFLVTSSKMAAYDGEQTEQRKTGVDGRALAPDIALTIAPVTHRYPDELKRADAHPVYYLPRQMMDEQDEQLDQQEDRVDEAIDQAQEAWDQERLRRKEAIRELKERIRDIRARLVGVPEKEKANDSNGIEGTKTDVSPKEEGADATMTEAKS